MKAYRDKDRLYKDIQGYLVKGRLAHKLHELTGVPEDPCGLKEIALFQLYMSDYQIVVVSVDQLWL